MKSLCFWLVMFSTVACTRGEPAAPVTPEPKWRVVQGVARPDRPLLVLLHGYGADENDLIPVANELSERFEVWSLRGPVELGNGRAAWYRLQPSPSGGPKSDPAELESARAGLAAWLKARAPRPVYLLGFSQGAILAMSIAASEPGLVRGAVAIAGRLPSGVPVVGGQSTTSVLILHGTRDTLIDPALSEAARATLTQAGRPVERQTFDAAHQITPEMKVSFENWLRAQAP